MTKALFYLENPNENEARTRTASYASLCNRFFDNMILCNDIYKADPNLELITGVDYDEENEEYIDIYQYFIVSINTNEEDIERFNYDNDIILYYSELLDVYILGVQHFGTSWSYVETGVEMTQNFDKYWNSLNAEEESETDVD